MKLYDIYDKNEVKQNKKQSSSVLDFFRKEINETRTFTRNLNANKNYTQNARKLVKTATTQVN